MKITVSCFIQYSIYTGEAMSGLAMDMPHMENLWTEWLRMKLEMEQVTYFSTYYKQKRVT